MVTGKGLNIKDQSFGKLTDLSTLKVCGKQQRFYAAYVACKGDWPWLRKAYALYSGFTSKRICHLCDVSDPLIYSDKF